MKTLLFLILGSFFSLTSFAGDVLFVQSVKAKLHEAPKMNAKKIAPLQRGMKLEVLEKKGIWYQVKHGDKTGWVSKLFVSKTKPIGHASLSKDVTSLEKTSRRRSSSYAVSASTRGLTANMRVRDGRALYRADLKALTDMESYNVKDEDLRKFQKRGQIAQ